MKAAKGEYIAFLDADDYWDSTFLEKMVTNIEKKNADICYCGYNIVSPNKSTCEKTKFLYNNVLYNYLLGLTKISTDCWLIRRDFLKCHKIKFKEQMKFGEDFYFFSQLLARTTKITFVKEYLSYYRVGFFSDRLTNHNLDKIDKDNYMCKLLLEDKRLSSKPKNKDAIKNYRQPMLIVCRLITDLKINKKITEEFILYYENNKEFFENISYKLGLPSLKMFIRKCQLSYLIYRYKN